MEELYLVAYTHELKNPNYHPEEDVNAVIKDLKSISFGTNFRNFRKLSEIVHSIEQQTGDKEVQVISVTPIHKLINYDGENENTSRIPSEAGH